MQSAVRTIRILVADDHEVVRKGVVHILASQPDFAVIGEVCTGRMAVQEAALQKPDVLVMDIMMPDLNGLEAARQISKVQPEVQVLILSMHESEELVQEILSSGARGYMLKSDAGRDLVTAVKMLAQKKTFFTSSVSEIVLAGFLRTGSPNPLESRESTRLSPREREIVQLLAEGKANKEVAAHLNISVKTVETHRSNVMHKLGLNSMSGLVRYAIRNKFTSL